MRDVNLDNDCIIRGSFVSKEAGLTRYNNCIEEGFEPIDNYLSDELIDDVEKSYGPKFFYLRAIKHLVI